MIYRIDPQAALPIFEQLVHQVKNAVVRGDLRVGSKLPSVRLLAREVSVNPNTVVKAYSILEGDGVIRRRQGAGCYITGKTNNLNSRQRARQLLELVKRTVTEAVHLGFSKEDLRLALDKQRMKLPDTSTKGNRK